MKKTLSTLMVCALLAVGAVAQNFTTNLATGITYVSAGGTSNALTSAVVETRNHEEVAVHFRQIYSGTNIDSAGNVSIITFGGSAYPSNLVAIATVTNSVGNTASSAANLGKNIYVGSYRYFGVISTFNGGTNITGTNTSSSGTPGTITLQFKDKRNGL